MRCSVVILIVVAECSVKFAVSGTISLPGFLIKSGLPEYYEDKLRVISHLRLAGEKLKKQWHTHYILHIMLFQIFSLTEYLGLVIVPGSLEEIKNWPRNKNFMSRNLDAQVVSKLQNKWIVTIYNIDKNNLIT